MPLRRHSRAGGGSQPVVGDIVAVSAEMPLPRSPAAMPRTRAELCQGRLPGSFPGRHEPMASSWLPPPVVCRSLCPCTLLGHWQAELMPQAAPAACVPLCIFLFEIQSTSWHALHSSKHGAPPPLPPLPPCCRLRRAGAGVGTLRCAGSRRPVPSIGQWLLICPRYPNIREAHAPDPKALVTALSIHAPSIASASCSAF